MERLRTWHWLAFSTLLTTGYFAAASPAVSQLLWMALLGSAVLAIELGRRCWAPRRDRPWHLLALGLAAMFLAAGFDGPWLTGADRVRFVVSDVLLLVGYPLIGAGAACFARAQSGGADRGPGLDAVLLALATTAVLWEVLLAGSRAPAIGPSATASFVVLLATSSWVAAMTVRLLLAGGHRSVSGWCLFVAASAGSAGAITFTLAGAPGRLITGHPRDLTWALAVVAVGAAATHPSMARLTEPAAQVERAQLISRVLLPGLSLTIPPTAVVLQYLATGATALVAAVTTVVIGLLATARTAGLVLERERVHRAVQQLAWHDPLTGLPNRARLYDRLEHALRRRPSDRGRVGVVFLDLDGFKRINDTWGHATGDAVLREVARRLVAVTRPGDTLARFAGDEFVLVLEQVDERILSDTARRIQAALLEPLDLGTMLLRADASVGTALAHDDEEPDSVLHRADAQMYAAKRAARAAAHVTASPATRHGDGGQALHRAPARTPA